MTHTDSSKIIPYTASTHGTLGNHVGLNPQTATREQCTQALQLLLAATELKGLSANAFSIVPVFESSRLVGIHYRDVVENPNRTILGGKFDSVTRAFRKSLETKVTTQNITDDGKHEVRILGETNLTTEKFASTLNEIARAQNKIEALSDIQANSAPSVG